MTRVSIILAILLCATTVVRADNVEGTYQDTPRCDNHGARVASEELGDPAVFSPGQQIEHVSTFLDQTACQATDDPNIPNRLVVVTNLTQRSWTDLFYVGDPSTEFSNVDGIGDGGSPGGPTGRAFRIDSVGLNRPLIFESIAANDIFEPGEQWQFLVQDYASPIGLPDSFTSIGFADASVTLMETSAASIVHFVPEPTSAIAIVLGLLGLAIGRRRFA